MRSLRIALSGSTGFIGSSLSGQFRALGHTVVPLARSAPRGEKYWIPFSLGDTVDASSLTGFDVLVHAAYDFRVITPVECSNVNVEGSIRLFDAARRGGVEKLVFVSSLSAFEGCRSQYGRFKLAVEQFVKKIGGYSIRLGFVCDDSGRGLSGRLRAAAARFPLIPVPGDGSQKLYPLAAADLGPAFESVWRCAPPGTIVTLARPEPVAFGDLLRAFGLQNGRSPILVPCPWRPLWLAFKLLEAVGIKLGFRSDSLLSLMNQDPSPDFQWSEYCGITLRPVAGIRQPEAP